MNGYRYRISNVLRILTLEDEALDMLVKSDTGELIPYFPNPALHGNYTEIETTATGGLVPVALDDKYTVGVGVVAKNIAVTDPNNPTGPRVPAYVKKVQQCTVRTVAQLDAWNPVQNAYDTYFIGMPDTVVLPEDAAAYLLTQDDFKAILEDKDTTVKQLVKGFQLLGGMRVQASNVDEEYGLTQVQGDVNLAVRGGFGHSAAFTPYKKAWRVTIDDIGWAAKRGKSILLAPNKLAWALPDDIYQTLSPAINYYGSTSQFRLVMQGEQVFALGLQGKSLPVRMGDTLLRFSDDDGRVQQRFVYGQPRPVGMPTGPWSQNYAVVNDVDEDGKPVQRTVIFNDAYSL